MNRPLVAAALAAASLAAVLGAAAPAQAAEINWQPPASQSINWTPATAPSAIPPIKPGWYCSFVWWCSPDKGAPVG